MPGKSSRHRTENNFREQRLQQKNICVLLELINDQFMALMRVLLT